MYKNTYKVKYDRQKGKSCNGRISIQDSLEVASVNVGKVLHLGS